MTMWFRSWHGAPTDPKWLLIARKADVSPAIVSAIVWALFDYASQHEDRGSVEGFDAETYAVWAGIGEDEIRAVIVALTDKGVIVDGRLTAWEKRQPKREDDSKERVRAHRQRNTSNKEDATQVNDPVTPCNAEVTHGNASEKIQNREDTEQKREKNTEAAARRVREPDQLFDAVVQVCYDVPHEMLTEDERGRVNKALPQLRKLEATSEQVHQRACEYRTRSPDYDLTPQTLTKSWNSLGRPRAAPLRNGRAREPDFSGIEAFSDTMDRLERGS